MWAKLVRRMGVGTIPCYIHRLGRALDFNILNFNISADFKIIK